MIERIVGQGGPRDPRAIPLATRLGNWIINERRNEQPPDVLRAAVAVFREGWPDAQLRSVTAVYNCFGLAFASRRTWVDEESILLIFGDDGYRRLDLEEIKEVLPGDLVVYRNTAGEICHIGVVVKKESQVQTASWKLWVLSKWGPWGEYLHEVDYVHPALGKPTEYWSERRLLT